ncbi:MAG: DUF4019 domain-containing protein [Gemmatimonadota bacterium]
MTSTKRATTLLTFVPALLLAAATSLQAQDRGPDGEPETAAGHEADVEAATEAALDWLEIVDGGDYGASWEEAAEVFKGAVTREQWNATVGQVRSQVGTLGERTLASSEYTTELPGAPAGEYVVLQFRTETSGDQTVTETVVPTREDGSWKVSGYFVRP